MGVVVHDPDLVGAPIQTPNTGWETQKKIPL